MTANIEKMYRQKCVDESQDLLKILLRNNNTNELQIYHLSTATYGTACAPYQATRNLNQFDKGRRTFISKRIKDLHTQQTTQQSQDIYM